MYRLIAYAKNGVQRFPVATSDLVVGSQPECDIYLPFTGVAKRHARILREDDGLKIEDLGTRKGTLVNGQRVREARLEALDEVRVGGITLLVEDVSPSPVEDGDAISMAPEESGEVVMTPESMTEHLAAISQWVLTDTESRVTLESLIKAVLNDFGGGVLFLCHAGDAKNPGIKFVATTDPNWLTAAGDLLVQAAVSDDGSPGSRLFEGTLGNETCTVFHTSLTAMERSYTVLCALPRFRAGEWSVLPAFRALSDLLIQGLVHHVGRYEPILPGTGERRDLVLAPGLVVGESDVMAQVMERLRSIADPEVHVLFCGEPGSGRELLARTLHLSSPRREGPFVVVNCSGAEPHQIEADLFGAEVPGREGPLRRESKLVLANGGTLFLEEPENLPLEQQARMVRYLRTGEVEDSHGQVSTDVDVRIMISASEPLEKFVAEDRFRVDLAYLLSQFVIDVPPVRERREDIPLLTQGYINRFCHETGKRIAGITVKTMAALASYDFPGNLKELENLARQMVYLCSSGQPVDVNLLPTEVRMSSLGAVPRIDEKSDLTLEKLVATCEQAAIREALRRSRDNKSEASRLLGISRNGLAMKMKRYGIRSEG
ncbi:MAG: sigma 54-interacting transcriptional regulator [Thermoanaerobaculia bacterium]|nr:sigma 54-interacting transcriptional regulator [Thermoanaerobaculia bacterium]